MEVWEGGGGGGGGGGRGSGCTAAVPCSNWISWPTISEFNRFYSPFEIPDNFFLVNLWAMFEMH